MMSEGAWRTLWSFACGNLTKFIPRFVQILLASGVTVAITITWSVWTPSDELYVLFLWAAAAGFVTAVYWTFTPGNQFCPFIKYCEKFCITMMTVGKFFHAMWVF